MVNLHKLQILHRKYLNYEKYSSFAVRVCIGCGIFMKKVTAKTTNTTTVCAVNNVHSQEPSVAPFFLAFSGQAAVGATKKKEKKNNNNIKSKSK